MIDALKTTGLVFSDAKQMAVWSSRVTAAAIDASKDERTQDQIANDAGISTTRLSAFKDPENTASTQLAKMPAFPAAGREVFARAILGEAYAVVALPEASSDGVDCVVDAQRESSETVTCALAKGLGTADLDREIDEAIVALLRLKHANNAARVPTNVAAIRRSR